MSDPLMNVMNDALKETRVHLRSAVVIKDALARGVSALAVRHVTGHREGRAICFFYSMFSLTAQYKLFI